MAERSLSSGRRTAKGPNRELVEFIAKHGMVEVIVDGCAVGTVNALHQPVLKQWRFIVSPNASQLIEGLTPLRCQHAKGFKHGELQGGSDTKKTENYPPALCRSILAGYFGSFSHAAALPCVLGTSGHREREPILTDFAVSHLQEVCAVDFTDGSNDEDENRTHMVGFL